MQNSKERFWTRIMFQALTQLQPLLVTVLNFTLSEVIQELAAIYLNLAALSLVNLNL